MKPNDEHLLMLYNVVFAGSRSLSFTQKNGLWEIKMLEDIMKLHDRKKSRISAEKQKILRFGYTKQRWNPSMRWTIS